MRFLFLILLLLIPSTGWACYVAPERQRVPPDELIARVQNIVLAKVIDAEVIEHVEPPDPIFDSDWYSIVKYNFKILKQYKGNLEEPFSMKSRTIYEGDITTFNNHEDTAFWEREGGRMFTNESCSIRPSFAVGTTYLLFLEPYNNLPKNADLNYAGQLKIDHLKGAEQIIRFKSEGDFPKDKWLEYVENKTK